MSTETAQKTLAETLREKTRAAQTAIKQAAYAERKMKLEAWEANEKKWFEENKPQIQEILENAAAEGKYSADVMSLSTDKEFPQVEKYEEGSFEHFGAAEMVWSWLSKEDFVITTRNARRDDMDDVQFVLVAHWD